MRCTFLIGLIVNFELSELVGHWVEPLFVKSLKLLHLPQLLRKMLYDQLPPLLFYLFLLRTHFGSELVSHIL